MRRLPFPQFLNRIRFYDAFFSRLELLAVAED